MDKKIQIWQISFVMFSLLLSGPLYSEMVFAQVGGTILPIDTTALLVAGLYTNALWIIPVIGGVAGIVIFTLKRSR